MNQPIMAIGLDRCLEEVGKGVSNRVFEALLLSVHDDATTLSIWDLRSSQGFSLPMEIEARTALVNINPGDKVIVTCRGQQKKEGMVVTRIQRM